MQAVNHKSTMTKAPTASEPSPLLELPAELRCLIYAFVFGYREQPAALDNAGLYACHKTRRPRSRDAALLRVSRAIHHEARPVLCDNTLFRVYFHAPEEIQRPLGPCTGSHFLDPTRNDSGNKIRIPASLVTHVCMVVYFRKRDGREAQVDRLEAFLELVEFCREMHYCEIDYSRFPNDEADLTDRCFALFGAIMCTRRIRFRLVDFDESGKLTTTKPLQLHWKLRAQAKAYSSFYRRVSSWCEREGPFPDHDGY